LAASTATDRVDWVEFMEGIFSSKGQLMKSAVIEFAAM
jgi:hypothetical protein